MKRTHKKMLALLMVGPIAIFLLSGVLAWGIARAQPFNINTIFHPISNTDRLQSVASSQAVPEGWVRNDNAAMKLRVTHPSAWKFSIISSPTPTGAILHQTVLKDGTRSNKRFAAILGAGRDLTRATGDFEQSHTGDDHVISPKPGSYKVAITSRDEFFLDGQKAVRYTYETRLSYLTAVTRYITYFIPLNQKYYRVEISADNLPVDDLALIRHISSLN
ncbi:hypothetical protein JNJ66_07520 [Candidatus Saccharibacteria bacterium]|nr:hypothetical protein [Candidatus Saccharibacteria bacterium]